jgi:uncharacterized delta-60 repeat protein
MKHIKTYITPILIALYLSACSEATNSPVAPSSGNESIPDIKDISFGEGGYRKSDFPGRPVLIDGRDMDFHPNGTIAIAGHFETLDTSHKQVGITLMDTQGNLIESFGNRGQINIEFPVNVITENLAFQGDNILVVARLGANMTIARIDQTGSLNTSFREGGSFIENRHNSRNSLYPGEMVVDELHRIYIAGEFNPNDLFVFRYLPDGQPDPSFGDQGRVFLGHDRPLHEGSLALSPDGRLMMSAVYSESSFNDKTIVFALLPDGSIDTSFGDEGRSIVGHDGGQRGIFNRGITVDQLGRCIVVNTSNSINVSTFGVIYRLNTDGSLDTSFGDQGYTVIDEGWSLGLFKPALDDDRIVVSGYLRKSIFDTDLFIIRLTNTGALDNTFGQRGRGIVDVGEFAEARDTAVFGGHYYLGGYVGSDQALIARVAP